MEYSTKPNGHYAPLFDTVISRTGVFLPAFVLFLEVFFMHPLFSVANVLPLFLSFLYLLEIRPVVYLRTVGYVTERRSVAFRRL